MTPNEKIAQFSIAPPLKRLKSAAKLLPPADCLASKENHA